MPDRPVHVATTVGVAVPVYNCERFVAEALQSVLAQSRPVAEVVVVDDGSDDASAQVASSLGASVRVVRQRHAGIGAARSRAMGLLQSEFLVTLDADDLLTPNSVEARLNALASRPDVDVVFGRVRHFAERAGGRPVALDQPQPAHVPGGMLIRRTAYERVGPFAATLRVAEALDWLLRARECGLHELTVSEQVLWRRVHQNNNSLTQRGSLSEFPRALKASLDRRRAGAG